MIFLAIFNHFLSGKNEFFCEEPTKYLLQNFTASIFKNIKPYLIYNWPKVACQKVPFHLSSYWHFFVDSTSSGSNFNYSWLIVCWWFFLNLLFGTQVSISSLIHQKFHMIPPLTTNGHAGNFDHILKHHMKLKINQKM